MWVGLPKSEIERNNILHGDMTGRFAYYRLSFDLESVGSLSLDISANSRYRLWVNGVSVVSGPCKGDLHRHYFETVDVTRYLRAGSNVLAAQVLYMDHYASIHQQDERAGIQSVLTPGGGHRLAVEGTVKSENGKILADVTTGRADWRVFLDGSRYLISGEATSCLGAVMETVDFAKVPHHWRNADFNADRWACPEPLETVCCDDFMRAAGLLQRFPMRERPIPLLYETPREFKCERRSNTDILKRGETVLRAGERALVILDAGEETSGYPVFAFKGGAGSTVKITYLEKFTGGVKDDAERGGIEGITDTLLLCGGDVSFEPFWYRTFRFIAIEMDAAETVAVYAPSYRETGYPLEVESYVESSAFWVKEVWDMCVRTLHRCMNETYMDCPYYEQNQFPMDTRLQALFCACVSQDRRLTMKALEDFHCSISPDGLVHGRYPGSYQQIISTFSLHYIFMLEETWRDIGDIGPLRRFLPDLDRILGYYDSKIGTEGLVGRLGYWEFVDWQPAWARNAGVPEAVLHGPSTIINLMYVHALERAAVLWEAGGRPYLAEEYRRRKNAILERVQALCWDERRGLYREGPEFEQYSQHAQAWAVLDGMAEGERARAILCHAMNDPDVLRVSFSTSYEWFRALEKAGLYGLTESDMARWAALPVQGNTTCPETPENSRSECHAWSALPIYEFIRSMAGIRFENGQIIVKPDLSYLPDLRGRFMTPMGPVDFDYRRENGKQICDLTLPALAVVDIIESNHSAVTVRRN